MKIYIAGPITGHDGYRERFGQFERLVQQKGHVPMNPARLPDGFEHEEYMHICYSMIDVCEAVFLLPGWEQSKGALLELAYANRTGKRIVEEDIGGLDA